MKQYDYLIVGAGLYGAVFAHEAKKAGKKCLVIDKRSHIAGNIYTEPVEGINVHRYGAHIFHTNNKTVWQYVNQFAEFNRYTNSPVANYHGEIYNLPFNMNTFNKMWGVVTPAEAKARIEQQKAEAGITDPQNLEEQAISLVGTDIYEKLIKGYTGKQWGRPCTELPAFIIKRLPVRFTYDDNYFNALYQGIPNGGYTAMVEKMLDGTEVRLNMDYLADRDALNALAEKVVYTGPVDAYFDYKLGALQYRSVRFETEVLDTDNYQGNAVVNYTDAETPYTRIIEHKHFEFGTQPKTVISREYSAEWKKGDEPYYPVNDEKNGALYAAYKKLADAEPGVIFGGRLGVSVEYYNRKTRDMLLNSPLPISTGFTGFNDNVGSLRNQGLEVSLRGTILDKRDFRWDATLMGSFNRNKVLSLTGGQDVITSGIRVIEVGRPIYTFYLPKTAGVDPATGKQLYYAYWTQTVNDEGALVNTRCDEYITDNVAMATLSKYYHESREPKLFGSIGSTFTILKNIDVSFLTTYSIGGWVYDGLYNGSMYVQYAGNNWHKNAKRRWQKPGDKTDVPMLEVGGSYATASNSLIDASYFAIKNITVGYTLPKRWLKKIDIESLRIYATLDNIAMFNHMDGMDPQYNFTGSVAYSYTPSRVIAFGIDLNF